MKTTIIALMFGAVITQEEGCERARFFEKLYDMYANWYTYDMFTQIMLIIFTLGLGIILFLGITDFTTSNNNQK